jgi:hypothetical protein
MSELDFELDLKDAAMTHAGLIVGGIVIRIDDLIFPQLAWTDAPVVVLSAFCDALSQLFDGHVTLSTTRFLEGAFVVEVCYRSPRAWQLSLISGSVSGDASWIGMVDPLQGVIGSNLRVGRSTSRLRRAVVAERRYFKAGELSSRAFECDCEVGRRFRCVALHLRTQGVGHDQSCRIGGEAVATLPQARGITRSATRRRLLVGD